MSTSTTTPRSEKPQVVLVTGASSGIGRATAHQAAERGDHVVLVARGAAALEVAAAECRLRGAASVLVLPTDVSCAEQVQATVDRVLAERGRIDVVVHSAGLVAYGRFEEVPVDVFDAVVRTNLFGSTNLARAVLPDMRRRDAGTLVLIGSLIGYIAPPYMSAYAVSKWGVRGLARLLQVENRDRRGVHIAHLSPGGVDTPIYTQAANYLGWVGRPPPPVVSPEKVAAAALGLVGSRRSRIQVGPTNLLTLLGFTALPGVFDRIVTPLFEVAAVDVRRSPAGPTGTVTGNVFAPVPEGNALHGGQGSPVTSIAAGVRALVGRARRR